MNSSFGNNKSGWINCAWLEGITHKNSKVWGLILCAIPNVCYLYILLPKLCIHKIFVKGNKYKYNIIWCVCSSTPSVLFSSTTLAHTGRAVRCASCWTVYATWWICWNNDMYLHFVVHWSVSPLVVPVSSLFWTVYSVTFWFLYRSFYGLDN